MIRSGEIVILCDENQETEILGIEMDIDNIQKMLIFSFVGELGSFRAVNVCPNTNDLVIKSHILERKNDNIRFCEKMKIKSPPVESSQWQFTDKFDRKTTLFVTKSLRKGSIWAESIRAELQW